MSLYILKIFLIKYKDCIFFSKFFNNVNLYKIVYLLVFLNKYKCSTDRLNKIGI